MNQKKSSLGQWFDGRKFVQGQVYWANDSYVSETVKQVFSLQVKGRRPVLIIQDDGANSVPRMPLILVAPLTASGRPLGLDYTLPAGIAGLDRKSVVQLSLIQPIPKRALEAYIGAVPQPHLKAIRERIAQKFGLIRP